MTWPNIVNNNLNETVQLFLNGSIFKEAEREDGEHM